MEDGAGFLFGQIRQVGSVEDGGDGIVDRGVEVPVAFAGYGFPGFLVSGSFFAFGPVVGDGAFFPAPLFGPFTGRAGELAVSGRPNVKGRCK